MFHKLPNDSWFEKLDPILKLWMYESWIQDLEDKNEFMRSYTILGGSFANPEMAKKMLEQTSFESTAPEDDFDKWSEELLNDNNKPKKKRRKIISM